MTSMLAIGNVQIRISTAHAAVYSVFQDLSKKELTEDVSVRVIPVSGEDQIVNVSLRLF